MPVRVGGYVPMELLPRGQRIATDHEFQAHWYRHVTGLATGKTVLDAGAGVGYGLRILREAGVAAQGFDVASIVPEVPVGRIEDYPDECYDWVLAIDVIEHVQDDVGFLWHLLRVAREAVFLATPNWLVSRATNHYHVREYTPEELAALTAGYGRRVWVSNERLEIAPRADLLPGESWNNFGVLLWKTS